MRWKSRIEIEQYLRGGWQVFNLVFVVVVACIRIFLGNVGLPCAWLQLVWHFARHYAPFRAPISQIRARIMHAFRSPAFKFCHIWCGFNGLRTPCECKAFHFYAENLFSPSDQWVLPSVKVKGIAQDNVQDTKTINTAVTSYFLERLASALYRSEHFDDKRNYKWWQKLTDE